MGRGRGRRRRIEMDGRDAYERRACRGECEAPDQRARSQGESNRKTCQSNQGDGHIDRLGRGHSGHCEAAHGPSRGVVARRKPANHQNGQRRNRRRSEPDGSAEPDQPPRSRATTTDRSRRSERFRFASRPRGAAA